MKVVTQVLPNTRMDSSNSHSRTASVFEAPTPIRLWHLASLDAPTVALVWSLAFAWAAHVVLPLWVPALLVLAVWSVYVTDRLLDARAGLRDATLHRLRDRHLFHWRHRRVLVPLAAAAAATAAWIVFNLMPAVARERNSVLAAASLVYFTRVHTRRKIFPRLFKLLSKELLVGLLFIAGCALPALTRVSTRIFTCAAVPPGAILWPLYIPVAFFALLAWLNCHAIDRWESKISPQTEMNSLASKSIRASLKGTGFSPYTYPSISTRALAPEGNISSPLTRIFPFATIVALAGLLLAAVLPAAPRASALLISAAAAALLLAFLDKARNRLTPIALRAAADLVLLTPLLLVPFLK